jgi:hypothetical protein
MKIQWSKIRWGKGILVGVLIPIISFLIVSIVIFIYGFILGFQVRGIPDAARINQFAPLASPILSILLTIGGAVLIARKIKSAAYENGVFIGIVVAVIGLGFSVIRHGISRWDGIIWIVLTLGAGLFGGYLATLGGRPKESLSVK